MSQSRTRLPPGSIQRKCVGFLSVALQLAGILIWSSPDTIAWPGPQALSEPPFIERNDTTSLGHFENLIRKEKFDEVEPLLRGYLAEHSNSPKAWYFLGYVLFRRRQVGDSVNALAKSLDLDASNPQAHNLLGRCLTIVGRYEMAEKEFIEAIRLAPHVAEAHYNLGRVASIRDDFHRAKAEFDLALRIDPDYMEAYNARGFAAEALGDDASALADYNKAVHLNEQRGENFSAPYVNLGGYYNRRGQFDLALQFARKAIALDPNSDLAYFQIAKARRSRQDWPGVLEAISKALGIRPNSSEYYYVLATVDRKLGRDKESEEALRQFNALEKQTSELESRRREARRAETGLEMRPQ